VFGAAGPIGHPSRGGSWDLDVRAEPCLNRAGPAPAAARPSPTDRAAPQDPPRRRRQHLATAPPDKPPAAGDLRKQPL
jgi:hypothetical protein